MAILVKSLTEHGLASLIPQNEEEARARFEVEKVASTPQSFDPLNGGVYWVGHNLEEACNNDPHFDPENKRLVCDEHGNLPCSVCFANARVVEMDEKNDPGMFDVWIEWVAMDAVEEATKRGLVGTS